MKALTAIFVALLVLVVVTTATAEQSVPQDVRTYQGKSAEWWAKRAVQNRKNSNARGKTIARLKKSMRTTDSLEECVKLATIAYPDFTEARAWQIIYHESWTSGKQFAKNRTSTASGLYQFLTSTFASTPYGRAGMSIWSPCASSLAAGWMHANGRGREWAIGSGISGN